MKISSVLAKDFSLIYGFSLLRTLIACYSKRHSTSRLIFCLSWSNLTRLKPTPQLQQAFAIAVEIAQLNFKFLHCNHSDGMILHTPCKIAVSGTDYKNVAMKNHLRSQGSFISWNYAHEYSRTRIKVNSGRMLQPTVSDFAETTKTESY